MYSYILIAIFAILAFVIFFSIPSYKKDKKISICKVADHPAINAVTNGIVSYVMANGRDIEIDVESAKGNIGLTSKIAAKFSIKKSDIVITIGTMPSKCFVKYALKNKFKLIFSSVTDPVFAKLITDIQKTDNNITGISNFVDVKQQLELFKEIQPNLRKLGMLYSPSESNSIVIIKRVMTAAATLGIEVFTKAVNYPSNISKATKELVETANAIFISNDNLVLSELKKVINIANKFKIPVYVSDIDAVEQGCIAALGPNQFKIGEQTGEMALKVLEQNCTKDFPVEYPKHSDFYINLKAAKDIGLKIPNKLITRATKVIR